MQRENKKGGNAEFRWVTTVPEKVVKGGSRQLQMPGPTLAQQCTARLSQAGTPPTRD
ncbi:hypothetical protein I79_001385 [Cricetulus griseus]|uniref:Uncharacterized protein n=1 Tax=Cricetulus griseus TaxID=10029 RepID=G3GUM1_CRIGR|nr:hypothetical protein I79_001385 [Cricetulus griseus]